MTKAWTSTWLTTQTNAICSTQGCGWFANGDTSARDVGQRFVATQARRHVEETGHAVQVERGQVRFVEART